MAENVQLQNVSKRIVFLAAANPADKLNPITVRCMPLDEEKSRDGAIKCDGITEIDAKTFAMIEKNEVAKKLIDQNFKVLK